MKQKTLLRWHWMPITVFLIGALSILLLVWSTRIIQRQRLNHALVDAVMDMQIHLATCHLWLEQFVGGDPKIEIRHVRHELDEGLRLFDAILNGGRGEHDPVLEPLRETGQRTHAEGIQPLLIKFRAIAMERLEDPGRFGIGSLMDQQFDEIFREISGKLRRLEEVIETERASDQARAKGLFLGILAVWTFIVIGATSGLLNREFRRKAVEEELLKNHEQLLSQARELEQHREGLAELVGKRTGELLSANKNLQTEVVERTQAEEALKESERELRNLSSQLLSAQETERRRISRELHDELGQALSLVKLRVKAIEKNLRKGKGAVEEDCVSVLQYLDQVIEDVRRLSRDLSPSILEDLGLTASLRWLFDNFSSVVNKQATLDIEEIDCLFSREAQIMIYRTLQEVLTNIQKHAGAENVSFSVRKDGGGASFVVEDDGKGFAVSQALRRDPRTRGLGLATIAERIRMLGGSLDIHSREGKGTRITFSVPAEKEKGNSSAPPPPNPFPSGEGDIQGANSYGKVLS